ncbi:hypothetical protein BGW41_006906 [Actinomortierella wolfii]|nr:hypothetical protein BGW41_006906 [Actinomortierella wolfii]
MSSPHNAPPPLHSNTPPPPSSTNTISPTPSNASGLPIPIIAGAGGGLVFVAMAITSWCVFRKRKGRRSPKNSSSSSSTVVDLEKQQLDPDLYKAGTSGHDQHPDKSDMTTTTVENPRKSTSSAAAVKVHKMYTPPSPKTALTSTHTRQASVPNVYASPRHSTSVPTLPPTSNTTADNTTNTPNSPKIPARRQSRSATVSSGSSTHVTFAQFGDLTSPSSRNSVHIDSVQIDIDSVLPSTANDEILPRSGATNTQGHSTHTPGGISSKAKRELLQQRQQLRRSPSFSMSNVPFPLAPLPPIPVSSNPTSPTLSPSSTPSCTSPIPTPSSSHRNSAALAPRSSLRRESRENRKSLVLQFPPPPPPPTVPIPAPPQDKLPLPPSQLLSTRRNPAFTHQRRTSSRGQELDEIVRQVREEDRKAEALYAAAQVSNHGTTCSRSTTNLQQSNVNISHGDGGDSQHPLYNLHPNPASSNSNNSSTGSSNTSSTVRSRMGPSYHYMPDEHQPPVASPPLPDEHAIAAAVEAAASATVEASTLANRMSTASHRLSKYNNASSPNLKLQAAEFNKEQSVSVREQARPRSRSFSSTLVPASLPSSLSSPPASTSGTITPRSSTSSPLGLASLPQHLQAPRPLLQQQQYPFLPSSSMAAAAAASTTTGGSSATNMCEVGLGISTQSTQLDQHLPQSSSPPPLSPPSQHLLYRQQSYTQLHAAQLPSANIPAQWRGRFAPDVEKFGGSTPRAKRSSTSQRSSTTDSPSPTPLSPLMQADDSMASRHHFYYQPGVKRQSNNSRYGSSVTSSSSSPVLSWASSYDELPSQTKERLLRSAAAAALHALPEAQPREEEEGGEEETTLQSHGHSRSSSVTSMSDSNASMSTPSRTPAQHYHAQQHHQRQRREIYGDDGSDVSGGELDQEGDDEELRKIIEDAIKIASAKAAAARAIRESMSGPSPDTYPQHAHAYQLSDSPLPPIN